VVDARRLAALHAHRRLGHDHRPDSCRRSLAIRLAWTALLQLWIWLDVPLGPAGPLHYPGR
jgi:hypothetical protein